MVGKDDMSLQMKSVALFGSADLPSEHPVCKAAFTVANELAQSGVRVVNGGGPGVMKAATDGAKAAGGETLAIMFKPVNAPYFTEHDNMNQADRTMIAANYYDRLAGLIDASDAYVIFQGGTGTLSEWTTVWLMSHIYYGHHKPMVLFGEFWHEVMEMMNKHFFVGDLENKVYKIVSNPNEVIPALEELEHDLSVLQSQVKTGAPFTESYV